VRGHKDKKLVGDLLAGEGEGNDDTTSSALRASLIYPDRKKKAREKPSSTFAQPRAECIGYQWYVELSH